MKKLVAGSIVSILLLYFSLRGVNFRHLLDGLRNLQYGYLFPVILLSFLILVLKSLRWGVILSPIKAMSPKKMLSITSIGSMAAALFPLRMGELVRPYLVSTRGQIPFVSALATIFVERVFDLMVLGGIVTLVMLKVSFPGWIVKSGYLVLASFAALLLLICLLYLKTETFLRCTGALLRRVPKIRSVVERLLNLLVHGFKIISRPKEFAFAALLTMGIWGFSGLVIHGLLFSAHIQLPLASAFLVLAVTVLGISLPSAPGFLGTFQMSCILALSLLNVSKTEALTFSVIYYLIGIGMYIFPGLLFLCFDRGALGSLKFVKQGGVGYEYRDS